MRGRATREEKDNADLKTTKVRHIAILSAIHE